MTEELHSLVINRPLGHTMEPAHWRERPDGAVESTGQPGPPSTVVVREDGIYVQVRSKVSKLGSAGEARWLALRLAEAAALWEVRNGTKPLHPVRPVDHGIFSRDD